MSDRPISCTRCGDTGKISRPKTADHILTDSPAWEWCPNCNPSNKKEVK